MYERSTNMTIFRIRSGHTLTNSHFNRFDKTKSSECRHCHGAEETPEHLLIHCTHFFHTNWWVRERWNYYVRNKYSGKSFNEIVVKDDPEMLSRLRKLISELGKFGVVM